MNRNTLIKKIFSVAFCSTGLVMLAGWGWDMHAAPKISYLKIILFINTPPLHFFTYCS